MKLLAKTNRYYISLTAVLFCIAGFLIYYEVHRLFYREITERLFGTEKRVVKHLRRIEQMPYLYPTIEVEETKGIISADTLVQDTLLFNKYDKEFQAYRQLTTFRNVNGKNFKVTIRHSLIESDEFIFTVAGTIGFVFILLFLILFFSNRIIFKTVWASFYKNLNAIKNFSIEKNSNVEFTPTEISEFQQLNTAVDILTQRAHREYVSLKEFTENASHEIQTPLAILQSKLELLIENQDLNEKQAGYVVSAYSASQRLSKLSQNLLLLAKIDNNQFEEISEIDLTKLIENSLEMFDEFIQNQNIELKTDLRKNIFIKGNQSLIEILINNLINNSIKHNHAHGKIEIMLNVRQFLISNTGEPPNIDPEKLFNRFQKSNRSGRSVGLGLAIAKKICEKTKMKISYQFIENKHILSVEF